MKRFFLFIIVAAFGFGIWTGCTVDESALSTSQAWECTDNSDCTSGFICTNSFCSEEGPQTVDCVDVDGDGYGVGEDRTSCRRCESFGQCDEDCDDTNALIHPGAGEPCNGVDDNCNMDIDEPTPCEDAQDCASLDPLGLYTVECGVSNICEVKMTTQICSPPRADCPCNADPLVCTAGSYPALPDPSECF